MKIFILLLLLSCGKQTTNTEVPAPTPAPQPPVEVEVPLPPIEVEVPLLFTANVKVVTTSATREIKFRRGLAIALKVINSKEFQDRVAAIKSFTSSSSTGEMVIRRLLSGSEKLSPAVDNEMDLEARMYYADNRTVGYTYPTVPYIYVNTKFFDTFSVSSVAANITHEYLHKLGYDHATTYSASRDLSVPYLLGSIVREMGKQYE